MAKDVTKNKNKKNKHKKIKEIKVTTENKCDLCVQSTCCTYITHQVDTPRTMEDFDYFLWQVSHDDVALFKDEDGWFLSVNTRCTHLKPNGMCGIYEVRPQICREHSNESCEFDGSAEEDFDKYFNSFESLDKYCRKRFKKWGKRFKKWNKKKK